MIDQDSARWLELASSTHRRLADARTVQGEMEVERRRAVRMAVASGVTHLEVARELGISRARVTVIVGHKAETEVEAEAEAGGS